MIRATETKSLHRVVRTPDEWKRRVAHAFGQAARQYHDHAEVQREVVARLVRLIGALPLPPRPRVLEIGCGTGLLTEALGQQLNASRWVVTDLSHGMVASCRSRLGHRPGYASFCMDGELPALRSEFDLVCSSMAMQWFVELEQSLPRLHSFVRPGGYLAFATLVEGTFAEWKEAHRRIGEPAAMLDYPSVARLQSLWPSPDRTRISTKAVKRQYQTPRDFLAGLKRLGAHTPGINGPAPTTSTLRRLLRSMASSSDFEVTYQVAYGAFSRSTDDSRSRAAPPGKAQ